MTEAESVEGSCRDLLEQLQQVTDPRKPRGIRHQLVSILALAAAAVVAGARSYVAVGQWAPTPRRPCSPALQVRRDLRTGQFVVPNESTIRRVLQACDGEGLDAVLGAWLYPRLPAEQLVVDGKTIRGARAGDGRALHVLAAMLAGSRTVIAQRQIAAKTNEITAFAPLLAEQDLSGVLVSADALHTNGRTPCFWSRTTMPTTCSSSKTSNPACRPAQCPCPGPRVPIAHVEHDRGHGRVERRTIQVLPAPDTITFPHAAQTFLAERYVADLHANPISADREGLRRQEVYQRAGRSPLF